MKMIAYFFTAFCDSFFYGQRDRIRQCHFFKLMIIFNVQHIFLPFFPWKLFRSLVSATTTLMFKTKKKDEKVQERKQHRKVIDDNDDKDGISFYNRKAFIKTEIDVLNGISQSSIQSIKNGKKEQDKKKRERRKERKNKSSLQ